MKVTVRFRGREMAHTNIGEQLLRDFADKCAELANLDKQPKLEGRNMSIFLSPKPQAPAKKPGKPKAPKPEAAAEGQRVSKPREGATKAMPKLKTHSGAKKRFNLTKTGKVKRAHAFKSHILTKKDTKRKRGLRQGAYADVTNESAIKRMIPYK